MPGFVDLHCHWVARIDDGAPSVAAGLEMLAALSQLGFDRVIATPHMRPGLFDNTREDLVSAYESMLPDLAGRAGLPEVGLASEHYFDDVVFRRILDGQAVPYPENHAILLEFYEVGFPITVEQRLFDLLGRRMLPVIAHPERYHALWKDAAPFERIVDMGCAALLDVAVFAGKYGKQPRRCAEQLLERGLYHAACSDAHRPEDVRAVAQGMKWVERHYGRDTLDYLFREGPLALLDGRLPD